MLEYASMKRILSHPLVLPLLIIALFVFFNSQGWLKLIEDAFLSLSRPIQKTTYQFSLKARNFADFVFSVRGLEKENNLLNEENKMLLGQITELKEAVRENEFLRKQLGLSIPETKELILANIISQEPSGLGEFILIDKGEEDGILNKGVVISAGNLLIGQVIETTKSFSKVRLISDPNSRINALIQESGITGLIESDQKIDLIINLLPQGESIEQGQSVVTSGLAGLFPPGLLIGQIEEIISSDAQIAQRARIKPAVDFNYLDKVFIIRALSKF